MPRKQGAWTPDKVRERIRTSLLVRRLWQHALGEVEMTATQVRSAEILLRKTLPDLTATELSGTVMHRTLTDFSRDELIAIASRGRADSEDGRAREPAAVHPIQ